MKRKIILTKIVPNLRIDCLILPTLTPPTVVDHRHRHKLKFSSLFLSSETRSSWNSMSCLAIKLNWKLLLFKCEWMRRETTPKSPKTDSVSLNVNWFFGIIIKKGELNFQRSNSLTVISCEIMKIKDFFCFLGESIQIVLRSRPLRWPKKQILSN